MILGGDKVSEVQRDRIAGMTEAFDLNLLMLGLLARPDSMAVLMPVEAWYVLSVLLAPTGYVVQDVVADAMTVEAVPAGTRLSPPWLVVVPNPALDSTHTGNLCKIALKVSGRTHPVNRPGLYSAIPIFFRSCNYIRHRADGGT